LYRASRLRRSANRGKEDRIDEAHVSPLAAIRVIAIEQFGAGPFATLHLADLGAEIIKIEDPATGGDVARYVPPHASGGDSLYFEAFNRGKRSLALDLKNPAGREVFERLVARSDAVFNNLRGDQAVRMRLTYSDLRHLNPAIVCASLSGYGKQGPRSAHPAYDALVQAEAGWAGLTGEPGGPPVKSGLSLADYVAGLTSALALMVALFDARRTGRGRDADTSLYDAALAQLNYPATWFLSAGVTAERRPLSGHPSIVPFQFFETADGYIAVACAKERFFRDLVVLMDLPGLAEDPRFGSFEARREDRDELLAILAERFRQRSTEEWLQRLEGKVPCAPVRSMDDALDAEELDERDMLAAYPHPLFGEVRSVGSPISFSDYKPSYRRAPALGEDRGDLLAELGYDVEEIARLEDAGAFGPM
jgi:crotonobetainyl-CoA:carnitine CoA-transferase CaiB-like acyl-CoA transferase